MQNSEWQSMLANQDWEISSDQEELSITDVKSQGQHAEAVAQRGPRVHLTLAAKLGHM